MKSEAKTLLDTGKSVDQTQQQADKKKEEDIKDFTNTREYHRQQMEKSEPNSPEYKAAKSGFDYNDKKGNTIDGE